MKKYLGKFVAICLFLSTLLVSNVSYARCFSMPCIWTRIVKANPGIPGFDYLQIGPEIISMIEGYFMADSTATVALEDIINFEAMIKDSSFEVEGINISGVGDLVKLVDGGGGFDVFSSDHNIVKSVLTALSVDISVPSSKDIAVAVKNLVVVKPEGGTYEEDKNWLENKKQFLDDSWTSGYSQALAMQQKISDQMEGVQEFITKVGDVSGGSGGQDSDEDIKKMMDKYKSSLVALQSAKLLALQATASDEVLSAVQGLASNKTDTYTYVK